MGRLFSWGPRGCRESKIDGQVDAQVARLAGHDPEIAVGAFVVLFVEQVVEIGADFYPRAEGVMGEQVDGVIGRQAEIAACLARAVAGVVEGRAYIRAAQPAVLELVDAQQAAALLRNAEQATAGRPCLVAVGDLCLDKGKGANQPQGVAQLAADLQVEALAARLPGSGLKTGVEI